MGANYGYYGEPMLLMKRAVLKSTQYIQDARAKCFAVHILEFEILQIA